MLCPDCHVECEEYEDIAECPECEAQFDIDSDPDDPEPIEDNYDW